MPHQLKRGFFLGIPFAKPGCFPRAGGSLLVLLLLHPLLLCAAPSDREAELLQVGDPVEVHERSGHHKHVEQLMGVELREGNTSLSAGPRCPPAPHSAEVHSNTEQGLTPPAAQLSRLGVKAHPSTVLSKIIQFYTHTHTFPLPFPSESSGPAGQPKNGLRNCCNSSLQRDQENF